MRSSFRIGLVAGVLITVLAAGVGMAPAKKPVSISGMKFIPMSIEITAGDTVRWTNDDDRDHTVVAGDGSFKSGNLRSGDSYEHTFDKSGKFAYSCSYHPRMKGTVVVSQ